MLETESLFSGSSGNSVYLKCGDDEYLIDAGVSFKVLACALKASGKNIKNIKAIFVTHEHSDHISGLDVLLKNIDIPVYINSKSAEYILKNIPGFRCTKNFIIKNPGEKITLPNCTVNIFKTPHDSCGSVGYRFDTDGESFGYATDLGYVTREIARNLFGCKTVIIESNHDIQMLKNGKYPYMLKQRILSDHGHLSNDACAKFLPHLIKNGAEKIVLSHLSKDNNTPEIAYETNAAEISKVGFSVSDINLCVAGGK